MKIKTIAHIIQETLKDTFMFNTATNSPPPKNKQAKNSRWLFSASIPEKDIKMVFKQIYRLKNLMCPVKSLSST